MDGSGATGWAYRVRELAKRADAPVLRLDGNFNPTDLEAFKEQWSAACKASGGRVPDLVLAPAPEPTLGLADPERLVITRVPVYQMSSAEIFVLLAVDKAGIECSMHTTKRWLLENDPQRGGTVTRNLENSPANYLPPAAQESDIRARVRQELAATLPAKVTREVLLARIASTTYEVRPDGRTTVCEITMVNGFTEQGKSSCVSVDEFKKDLGEKYAFEDVLNKVWAMESYLLRERRFTAGLL